VLVIAEENHSYSEIIGNQALPYINGLSTMYGSATNMDAGYPTGCPSLAAYLLLTSGSTHGICDDRNPSAHPLPGDSIFAQVAATGRQWRNYAESATGTCATTNSGGRFLVRHTPSAYYISEAGRCQTWDVPLGSPTAGALYTDVGQGTLPAYGFVTPDACDDMHGAGSCLTGSTGIADTWLRTWIPLVLAGPDYRAGRLVVIITWDEGTHTDNHIPTILISPTTQGIQSATQYTHCSTLRTTEEILQLPLLGCAASAPSMRAAFQLGASGPS
jgi:phosphatidylinositol-3-phosphatase